MRTKLRHTFRAFAYTAVAIASMLPGTAGEAATRADIDLPGGDVEIVVLEAPGCVYCPIFRRDVLPSYQASAHAKMAPLRFLDINDEAADKLSLDEPVTVVPTVVILKQRREIGRIPGYVGPDNFFHVVDSVLRAKNEH